MQKNKSEKTLVIVFCIVFIIMSIAMSIMKENTFHTEHCNISNCNLCNMINFSTDIIRNIISMKDNSLMFIISVFMIRIINKCIQEIKKLTLVELKVIQNK